MFRVLIAAIAIATLSAAGFGQADASSFGRLAIGSESLPEANPNQEYVARLQASGGVAPLHWDITSGKLPKGLELDSDTGAISGTAVEAGDFEFTITVTDSAHPPHTATRVFKLISIGALSVEWRVLPRVDNDQITGSVTVANGTKDRFDLTMIVVAVNEVGKAFALGYQQFDLRPDNKDVEIKFGSSLPRGQYIVHADAIAEITTKNKIYRNRLQTPRPLTVTAPSF